MEGPSGLPAERAIGKDLALGSLGTCKAVMKEAIGMFFAQDLFRFDMQRTAPEEADLWALLRAQPMIEAELNRRLFPEVHGTLKLIDAKNVASMRSLLFVCHNEASPAGSLGSGEWSLANVPETGQLARRLDLLRRAPFSGLVLDGAHCEYGVKALATNRSGEERLQEATGFVTHTICHRRLRSLVRRDVCEFAQWIRVYCEV